MRNLNENMSKTKKAKYRLEAHFIFNHNRYDAYIICIFMTDVVFDCSCRTKEIDFLKNISDPSFFFKDCTK